MMIIPVSVIFVLLLFIELVPQNTKEIRNIWEMKNKWKRFYHKGLFQDLTEKKPEKFCNPKSLKQIAGEILNNYEEEVAIKMAKPYYFTDKALQLGSKE